MVLSVHNHNRVVKLYNNKIINCMVNGMRLKNYSEILYPIFDYPHEHYTFKHFEV